MQILQWLAKVVHEQPRVANASPVAKKQGVRDSKVKSKDIVVFNNDGIRRRHFKSVERTKLSCENLNLFYFIRRKDVSKACFYHTLHLKRVGTFWKKQHSVDSTKAKKEDIVRGGSITQKEDSATHHVGNKVLPVSDSARASSSSDNGERADSEKKKNTTGEKLRTVSRMMEFLKLSAVTKNEKKDKYIGRKKHPNSKAEADDDQLSTESPKISLNWEVESSSTIFTAAHSQLSRASSLIHDHSLNVTPLRFKDRSEAETGIWIHTDSEFVVLEL